MLKTFDYGDKKAASSKNNNKAADLGSKLKLEMGKVQQLQTEASS